ncbi:hypothetical protein AgCh_000207 [Apium graveolens]
MEYGKDTRSNFTSHPYFALDQGGIQTFMDEPELEKVGIIVCYGVFSRKNGKVENVSSDVSASCGSRISYVNSFFDNGVENAHGFCGNFGEIFDFDEFGESRVSRLRKGVGNVGGCGENFGKRFGLDEFGESSVSRLRKGVGNADGRGENLGERCDFDEIRESRFSRLRNGVRNFDGVCEKNVGKEGNSECFVGESMVFVGNGNYEVKPEARNVYRPLNLPVRSLKSRNVGCGGNYEDTNLEGGDKIKKVMFRGLVPINLDDKFRETIVSSPIPWGSRSGRMGLRENVGNVKPTFVGKAELVRPGLPNVKPLATAVPSSEMGEFQRKERLRVSFPPISKSSPEQLKSKPSSSGSSCRRFSTEVAVEENAENNLKGFSKGKTEEDLLNTGAEGVVSLNLDVKPATLLNAQSVSGSFSELTLENKSKNDLKGLRKGKKEESICKQNICIESSKLDKRHACLVEGELQNGSSSEMCCETSSDQNLKGSEKNEKGDLLRRENMSNDFWNLDLNSASLVDGRCRTASSSEINGEKKSETISMDFGNHKKEDLLRRKKKGSIDSLEQDVKTQTTVKGLTRGKSVRTRRSNEISVEVKRSEEVYSSHIGDRFVKHCDEDGAGVQKRSDRIDGLKSEADERGKKNRDKPSDTKTLESRKNQNGERQKNSATALVKSESIFADSENFQVIADEEERRPGIIGDNHIESNEVDKKAAEFIAKFRKQIRLQTVALKR